MTRTPVRVLPIAAIVFLTALFATGCGSNSDAPAGAKVMSFKLTDAGCVPNSAKAPAGPITFEVENAGTTKVTEFEVLDGETILGEKENLSEGFSGSFSLTLEQGQYTLYCPGGEDEHGTLTVSGELTVENSPEVDAAIAEYRKYLKTNADELVVRMEDFVTSVIAGDVVGAKAQYAPTRIPYERIEPVAESFGTLDPRIDARENDVPPGEFEGFHRIEKALWVGGTTAGMGPVVRQLFADIEDLRWKVQGVELQAVQIANGANELLGEVSASKITGEEERYSHIDLVDFEANVEGAKAAYQSVRDLVEARRPALAQEIDDRFADVESALQPYREGSGFVAYTALTKADTRGLSRSIDALAEPLSEVGAVVAGQ
jgi:iron uptake system component EfeO